MTSAGEVTAPFPPTLGEELPLWGAGSFTVYEWRAPGDGSWQPNQTIAFGTGAVGAGLMIGSLLGGVIGNSRAAEAAAIPRWMVIERGGLYLSHRGFYLHTERVLTWGSPHRPPRRRRWPTAGITHPGVGPNPMKTRRPRPPPHSKVGPELMTKTSPTGSRTDDHTH